MVGPEFLDHLQRDTSVVRRTRAGANQDGIGFERSNFVNGDFVVTVNMNVGTELAQVLHEDVDERVVVVDYDHAWSHNITVIGRRGTSPEYLVRPDGPERHRRP